MTFREKLISLKACDEALEWVGDKNLKEVWDTCPETSWLCWLVKRYPIKDGPIFEFMEDFLKRYIKDVSSILSKESKSKSGLIAERRDIESSAIQIMRWWRADRHKTMWNAIDILIYGQKDYPADDFRKFFPNPPEIPDVC